MPLVHTPTPTQPAATVCLLIGHFSTLTLHTLHTALCTLDTNILFHMHTPVSPPPPPPPPPSIHITHSKLVIRHGGEERECVWHANQLSCSQSLSRLIHQHTMYAIQSQTPVHEQTMLGITKASIENIVYGLWLIIEL